MGFEETIRKMFFRKPKIELEGGADDNKPAVPEKVSVRCEKCRQILLSGELDNNHKVCPKCGYHFKIGARERITALCDNGEFTELFAEVVTPENCDFPGYDKKLEKAREESGESEGAVVGIAKIAGMHAAVFAMDHRFMIGSMGHAVGERITRLFEYATLHRYPVIGFALSGGARMQERIASLMQMAKTSAAVGRHSDAGLLYISVLTNPTTGGVSASFAFLGDIIVAEPDALIGFAGPRVIEQTTRQKLPAGFQRAEFLQQKGYVDLIVKRTEMKARLGEILALHAGGKA
ncbi:MAG: acetyl-CoA carboxylase carboxyltransferase subunit beta [Clostridia bacterium]|jgi:acetyl-CoA carboxylase carboxyl transferase beta subunit|nr:acetyl-CoA carboxylase carboxyltransferase subunit beta [Clostridia bacterium]